MARSSRSAKPPAAPPPERAAGPTVDSRFRSLRASEDPDEANHLVIATIRVQIPTRIWLGGFSRTHPSLRIEVMNRSEMTPDVSVSDYWVSGVAPGSYAKEIAAFPDVLRVDCLAELGGGRVYRVIHQNPPVVYLYRELGIPLQFPLRIRAGQIFWETCARESDFRRILEHVFTADPTASILCLRRRAMRNHMPELTDSQHALLTAAMAEGYFAVPRSITLTDLARKLGRSKSSISESLALIEKKVLEAAMRPPPGFA